MLKVPVGLLITALALVPVYGPQANPTEFVFVAGGDMIGPYRTMEGIEDPGFARVAQWFKSGDVGLAKQEGALFDLTTFVGYPSAETGGGYPVAPSVVARDYRAMGITVVSKANNHGTDWGGEGMVATLRSLEAAGIAWAGGGRSDVEARAPGYVATRRGKAALVSTASTFPPAAVAGPAISRRGLTSRPRPGISALHTRSVRLVTTGQLTELRRIAGPVGSHAGPRGEEVRIGDQYFRASRVEGTTIEADPTDVAAVISAIRDARRNADFVIFAIHAHETAGNDDDMAPVDFEPMVLHRANEVPSPDDPRPANFEPALFHQAIDAGADVVVRTGPHVMNGIELYHGKPIFYGLGSLFFVFGPRRGYTAPSGQEKTFPNEWYEAVIPVASFRNGELAEIRLHPISIESSAAPTDGYPHPAGAEEGQRILERLRTLSAAFGTQIVLEEGVGIIRSQR